ncbi:MAG: hypothetical protein AB1Z98_25350 [Nannocystaceae bacterium]
MTTNKALAAIALNALALVAVGSGCSIPEVAAEPVPVADRSAVAAVAEPEVQPEVQPEAAAEPASPAGMPQLDAPQVRELRGRVDHVERAGPYTYVQLDEASGGHWVVVMGVIEPEAGQPVAFSVYGTRTNFHSKRLDRELPQLHFGSVKSPT